MRFKSLDALRGVAATQVVVSHTFLAIPGSASLTDWWVRWTPLRLVLDPRPAVIFFFVLSGVVLTLSLRGGDQNYRTFISRRFCRIYLPFAAAIVAAQALCFLIGPTRIPGLQEPIASDWADYSATAFMRHFLMLGFRNDIQLDGVVWSLTHEMRIAFIMPLVVAMFVRNTFFGLAASLAVSVGSFAMLSTMGQRQFFVPESSIAVGLLTGYYLFPFAVGVAVALHWKRLVEKASKRWTLAASGALFVAALIQRPQIAQLGLNDFAISALAGGLIVLVLASPRLEDALNARPVQWLGRISYSLYLTHLLVNLTFLHLLSGLFGIAAPLLLAFPMAFLVAAFFNHWVERPCARLARGSNACPYPPERPI